MKITHNYEKQITRYSNSDFQDIAALKKRCLDLYNRAKYREIYRGIYSKTIADTEFKQLKKEHRDYFFRFSKVAIKRLKPRFTTKTTTGTEE